MYKTKSAKKYKQVVSGDMTGEPSGTVQYKRRSKKRKMMGGTTAKAMNSAYASKYGSPSSKGMNSAVSNVSKINIGTTKGDFPTVGKKFSKMKKGKKKMKIAKAKKPMMPGDLFNAMKMKKMASKSC